MKQLSFLPLIIILFLNLSLFVATPTAEIMDEHSSATTLSVTTPIAQWGYGSPRDVAWTSTYLAVASTAGVWIFDPDDLDAAPHRLGPMDDWPTNITADPTSANRLAVTSGDSITIWNVGDDMPLLTISSNGNPLFAPAFSQDGTRLIASSGFQAFVWNTKTGALIQTFGDEATPVTMAALSPDGRLVFSGSREGALRLWEVDTGDLLTSDFPINPTLGLAQTRLVAFTPDGQQAVSADLNGHIRFWPLDNSLEYIEYERPYQGDPNTPTALAIQFLPDARFITAEDSTNGGVRLWQTGDRITELAEFVPNGYASARRLAVSPDGQQVAVVMYYEDGQAVDIIDIASFAMSQRVGDFHSVEDFALSPNGTLLMTEGPGNPWLYNTADGSVERVLTHHGTYVTGAAISPENDLLIACVAAGVISYEPTVEAWMPNQSSESFTLLEKYAFSSGGVCEQTFITEKTIGFVSYDGVYTRPRSGGDFTQVLALSSSSGVYSALDDENILIGNRDSGLYLFDPQANSRFVALIYTPQYQPVGVWAVALNTSNMQMARQGEANAEAIEVFDISGDEARKMFTFEADSPVTTLTFSLDGFWLASGHSDGKVLLWNLKTGQSIAELTGKFGMVHSVAFSPQGDRLYAAGQDKVMTVWALEAGPSQSTQ